MTATSGEKASKVCIGGTVVAVLLPPSIHAQTLMERINWQGSSGTIIAILAIFFGGSAGILMLLYTSKRKQEQKRQKEAAQQLFQEAMKRYKFTDKESRKARELLRHEPHVPPQTLLQSISLFEKCIDAEINNLRQQSLHPDRKMIENSLISGIRNKLGFSYLPLEHPLVSSRNISLGQSGSLYGKSNKHPIIHRAAVVEKNEFSFSMRYDTTKEESYRLVPGQVLKFAFTRHNDGVYGIPLTISCDYGNGTLEFLHNTDIRRDQQRKFVRIDLSVPLKFRLISTQNPSASEIPLNSPQQGTMVDISGGGLSFLCPFSLKPSDSVLVSFQLPSLSFAGVTVKILRVSLQEGAEPNRFRHHAQFVKLPQSKQEHIVKYVFEKQRQANQWR